MKPAECRKYHCEYLEKNKYGIYICKMFDAPVSGVTFCDYHGQHKNFGKL